MEELKGDIQRLNAEMIEVKRRLDNQELNDKRHEEDIRELYKAQEGTKVYVAQILNKLESLEQKLFGLVTHLSKGQEKERDAERSERSQAQQNWIDFAKFLVAATIGAVIFYMFEGSGK